MIPRRLFLAGALAAPALAARPRRVVVAGGGLTEIVWAIGAQDCLVGVDSTSLFPAAARALPQVGYMRALGAEGVLSLRPDLIILVAEAGPPPVIAQLEAAGVKLLHVPPVHDAPALLHAIALIGEALDYPREAAALAEAVRADFDALATVTGKLARVRCLFLLSLGSGPLAAGRDTAADAMLGLAAGENVISAYAGYRPLSAESALLARPDAIVTTDIALANMGGPEAVAALPSLAMTPAARARRVIGFETLFLLGFGPRSAHAAWELAHALHPDAAMTPLPDRPWLRDPRG